MIFGAPTLGCNLVALWDLKLFWVSIVLIILRLQGHAGVVPNKAHGGLSGPVRAHHHHGPLQSINVYFSLTGSLPPLA